MMTAHDPLLAGGNALDARPHAIVIGAGFGGLAAAIRLGARGYRVTIVEKFDAPGGRAAQFRQDGYVFDAGPTIVTAPFIFEELWALCGRKVSDDVTLVPLDPFYTVRFDDGTEFRVNGDEAFMEAEVAKLSPGDIGGYRRYLDESKRCFKTGFLGMIDRVYLSLGAMAGAMPALVMRRAERSIYKLVSKYIRNEKLRQALSFHPLFIGGNPMRSSGVLSLISYLEREYGVHYAMGGTHALVRGMTGLIAGQGGTIRTGAEVDEITVEGRRATGVRLVSGEVLSADIVVSNADTGWTYTKLLRNLPRKRWTDAKVNNAKYSMSLFVWYFGTDCRYEDVEHHTVLLGKRYGGLLHDIFDAKILADDFSLYLYRPTATDTSVAPKGCDTFYVLSPVPNLDGKIDWETGAEPYRQKIQAYLESSLLPGLGDHLVTSRVITPEHFHSKLLSVKGAAFGMEPTILQLAWFRPHNKSEELDNLYIVGAGTHPGAGLPGVVSSAKILDKVVPHASTFAR
ncbi:phytoene desaturase family protein [Hoeflea olei]|uniref:Phytoene dehydrogenase n=1 Tax=Hoeflea olei TaxID=1480615 RepID=A0A1C1YY64_9HYPH|nr:phytoene desaturase family protein [Hoeflea olei]OCW58504.1 phytoene dehydrogenase [Hoeflea olei]